MSSEDVLRLLKAFVCPVKLDSDPKWDILSDIDTDGRLIVDDGCSLDIAE